MKIKKQYTYSNNRQIWRLIPAEPDKLIIEERNTETKEAFFNCIEIDSGKKIFKDYQFEEKFWVGIETVYKGIIFFNKYLKPEMPQHKGIIALDIKNQKIVWEEPDLIFLLIRDDKLYCYKQLFEKREYYLLDYASGNILEKLGDNAEQINTLRIKAANNQDYNDYLFPQKFYSEDDNPVITELLNEFKTDNTIIGQIEYIKYGNLILMNTFEPGKDGDLNNIFRVIDIEDNKVIFEDVLNRNARAAVPDSFFMKRNFVFILKEKTALLVCAVKK